VTARSENRGDDAHATRNPDYGEWDGLAQRQAAPNHTLDPLSMSKRDGPPPDAATHEDFAAKIVTSTALSKDGVPVGNTFDKYGSANPLVRRIMKGYTQSLDDLLRLARPRTIHEVGCGEGYWVLRWRSEGMDAIGSDYSEEIIAVAMQNALAVDQPPTSFMVRDIYDLASDSSYADTLVCCEVLEHLEDPEAALDSLRRTGSPNLIISVPREALWSGLNMARAKYMLRCGSTPWHIHRWSKRRFVDLVSRYFRVEVIRTPIPWTMVLCSRRGNV